MHEQLTANDCELPAQDRWNQRRWLACVVCAEGRWNEDLLPTVLTGARCSFKKPLMVADLLDAEQYIRTWPRVPPKEVRASSVKIVVSNEVRLLLLHKRRISEKALTGEEAVNVCADC